MSKRYTVYIDTFHYGRQIHITTCKQSFLAPSFDVFRRMIESTLKSNQSISMIWLNWPMETR